MGIVVFLLLVMFFGTSDKTFAATCYGNEYCRACKNCNYCKHCNSGGSPCGVYYASRGMSPPSATPVVAPQPVTPPAFILPPRTQAVPVRSTIKKRVARPAAKKQSVALKSFENSVRARILQSWSTYNATSPMTARIFFQITKNGDLTNLKLLYSNGDKETVNKAVEAVGFATPFPRPPSGKSEDFVVSFRDGNIYATASESAFETEKITAIAAQTTSTSMTPLTSNAIQSTISKVIEGGKFVVMQNGTVWPSSNDTITYCWYPGDKVLVTADNRLLNTTRNTQITISTNPLLGYSLLAETNFSGEFAGADHGVVSTLENGMIFEFRSQVSRPRSYKPKVSVLSGNDRGYLVYKLLVGDSICDVVRLR